MYYVGIDIAKRFHVAAVEDERGRQVGATLAFANDEEGFNRLIHWLDDVGVAPDDALVAMESTAHYWVSLYAWLDNGGFSQAVINPIMTDAYRRAWTVRKTKTDVEDALMIADFARFRSLEP